ncbi:hypothetical protein EDL99_00245 [Ornithobacterium rhinotracheale]|nr:hypothetical protein [Ornithobacterium rhinotracheale]
MIIKFYGKIQVINSMKKFLALLFVFIFVISCGDSEGVPDAKTVVSNNHKLSDRLWATNPWHMHGGERLLVYNEIQKLADNCSSDFFKSYLESTDDAKRLENSNALLDYYSKSLDKVINEIQNVHVETGSVVIWMLYNMGYVVKTPSMCFGIDIMHKDARLLAPYLDFLCVTHNHRDHYDKQLISEMLKHKKPVLSNFIEGAGVYKSKIPTDYQIGNCKIKVSITDHNNSKLFNFVSVFSIDCGVDANHFKLMHVGDSNYKPKQYTNIFNKVNLLIPRYAPNPLTENNILGIGQGKVIAQNIFLSHILELTHAGESHSRWSFKSALERADKLNNENVIIPFWGEKFIWKNNSFEKK